MSNMHYLEIIRIALNNNKNLLLLKYGVDLKIEEEITFPIHLGNCLSICRLSSFGWVTIYIKILQPHTNALLEHFNYFFSNRSLNFNRFEKHSEFIIRCMDDFDGILNKLLHVL